MRAKLHPRRIHPDEERRVGRDLSLDEVDRRGGGLVVDGHLALLWTGILDGLLADSAEVRVNGGIILVAGLAPDHAARTEFGPERLLLFSFDLSPL